MRHANRKESKLVPVPHDKWINQVVCRNYILLEKIDHGSFGMIFRAKRQHDNSENQPEKYYAVKIEENTHTSTNQETLTREAKIIYDLNGEKGFPRMYYFLKTTNFSSMVTTLLDQSLEKLHERGKIFSLKTVLMLVDQMLTRIQYLHSKGYIHRYGPRPAVLFKALPPLAQTEQCPIPQSDSPLLRAPPPRCAGASTP